MKNLAFLINDISNIGGTQKVVRILAKGFLNYKDVNVVIYSLNVKNKIFNIADFDNVKIISLNESYSFLGILRAIIKINKYNSMYQINTVIGIGAYLSIFLPFVFSVKRIASEHNSYSIVSRTMRFIRILSYKFVDKVVSLTEHDLFFYKSINKNSIVIPNPIDAKNINQVGFPERKDSIIAVGTLTKRKGFERLLDLWTRVESQVSYSLDIYGDGEEYENLISQSKCLGHRKVVFHGNVEDIESHYDEAKIFVMTSYTEGFPMVILEAMKSGLPCISFDIETGPNELIDDGINGFLIPDGDKSKFEEKLIELANDEDKLIEMSKNATKTIVKYQVESIVKKWIEII